MFIQDAETIQDSKNFHSRCRNHSRLESIQDAEPFKIAKTFIQDAEPFKIAKTFKHSRLKSIQDAEPFKIQDQAKIIQASSANSLEIKTKQ